MSLAPAMLRALTQHGSYWIPGETGPDGGLNVSVLRAPDGERILPVFRSRTAAEAAQLPVKPGALADVSGSHIFRMTGFDRMDIDPGGEGSLTISGDDLITLGVWASIADVEYAIEAPEKCEAPMVTLREFSRYLVLVDGTRDAPELLMAPDTHGRQLVAVFTADDAVERFVQTMAAPEGVATTMPGKELFFALRQLSIDGFVFNCCGPCATRAFAMGVIDRILTEGWAV